MRADNPYETYRKTPSKLPKPDQINPSHYKQGKIEVFDFIKDQKMGYAEGCIIKYVCRYKHKGKPLEDLKKAEWYLKQLIKNLEGEQNG